jgi:hypothetical protein
MGYCYWKVRMVTYGKTMCGIVHNVTSHAWMAKWMYHWPYFPQVCDECYVKNNKVQQPYWFVIVVPEDDMWVVLHHHL